MRSPFLEQVGGVKILGLNPSVSKLIKFLDFCLDLGAPYDCK
jgi:hypothetical protein